MTFAALIHLLRAHMELYESLLALSRRKTEALKKTISRRCRPCLPMNKSIFWPSVNSRSGGGAG
ncbi:hypothetical protein GBL_1901 [Geobacillus kaustophilus GBlys]|uniref:Uncharacterized protein n=1 Tax=Geobacillus kaustophilus GBlys TaxID=1337888 RepID=U2Y3C4_GEOKU|nr:hypothetical protein GBL_1901 [Geobacillus kaustophilus GBlys]